MIPGLGRSPGEGNGNPLQYSWLENLMDRGASWATDHGLHRVGHNLAIKQPHRIIFCIVIKDVFYKNDSMTWESLYY